MGGELLHNNAGSNGLGKITEIIGATTDFNSLVKVVAETYNLSLSRERDVAHIKSRYQMESKLNDNLHEQIMLALGGMLIERSSQISFIETAASRLIELGQYDTAHKIIEQLMITLRISPLSQVKE